MTVKDFKSMLDGVPEESGIQFSVLASDIRGVKQSCPATIKAIYKTAEIAHGATVRKTVDIVLTV